MRNTILVSASIGLLMLLAISLILSAQETEISLPPGTALSLPRLQGIRAEWLVPASDRKIEFQERIPFEIDRAGEPWLGLSHKILFNPVRKVFLEVDTEFQDFVFLGTEEFVVITGGALGTFIKSGNQERPLAQFIPILRLPGKKARVFPGAGASLYLLCSDPEKEKEEVYLLQSQGSGRIEKLFETNYKIAAVGGDGQNTYLAIGKTVVRLRPEKKEVELIFRHPRLNLTGLEYADENRLFYTTNESVGYIGQKQAYEFAHLARPEIKISGSSLYILLSKTLGIIKIDGIDKFEMTF